MKNISISRRNTSETTSHAYMHKTSRLKDFAAGKLGQLRDLAAAKFESFQAYSFPVEQYSPLLAKVASSALIDELEAIESCLLGCSTAEYFSYRERKARIHIELNMRGSVWPAFRPMSDNLRQGEMASWASEARACVRKRWNLQDRQVIDMHWVFALNQRAGLRFAPWKFSHEIRNLCWGATFEFDRAARYAAEEKAADVKADELGIPFQVAINLSWLQNIEMASRMDKLLVNGGRLERFIREIAKDRPWLRGRSRAYKWIWVADQMMEGSYGAKRDWYVVITKEWLLAHDFRKHLRRARSLNAECLAS
ncbi:hypothetical protein [Emcibacter sp. SYSU 3D8]|uniref:hypothetical protein n=1 Tax=Emcibacter sp. SYSU 3D8 TaxID=3133969 RepID=UPI0031FF31A5